MKQVIRIARAIKQSGFNIETISHGTDEYDPMIEIAGGVSVQVAKDGGFLILKGRECRMAESRSELLGALTVVAAGNE